MDGCIQNAKFWISPFVYNADLMWLEAYKNNQSKKIHPNHLRVGVGTHLHLSFGIILLTLLEKIHLNHLQVGVGTHLHLSFGIILLTILATLQAVGILQGTIGDLDHHHLMIVAMMIDATMINAMMIIVMMIDTMKIIAMMIDAMTTDADVIVMVIGMMIGMIISDARMKHDVNY
jgi:hypothetical protein